MFLFSFLHVEPSFNVYNINGFESTYVRAFESLLHCLFFLQMSSFFFPSSDIGHQSSVFFHLHILFLPFFTVIVLFLLFAYAKS